MILSIIVRDLKFIKHFINKYACCFMYFSEKIKNNLSVFVEITKEIHLVNSLKINFLIENDILNFEFINIFTSNNTTFIENCNVIISIIMKFRFSLQTKAVHATKLTTVLSHSKVTIFIYKIVTFERDYIFEFKRIANFAMYAHLIDNDINAIVIRNDNDKSIQVSRNFQLEKLIDIDFSNAMYIDTKYVDLALKRAKYKHKSICFQKNFKASIFYTNMINMNSIFFNLFTEQTHFNKVTIQVL